MSRVFVVQNTHHHDGRGGLAPKFDVSPAQRFGEIIYLLGPGARPFRPELVIPELHEKLRDFGDTDYLLLIGSPVLIGITVAIASQINHGRVRMLQWSASSRDYVPIEARLESSVETSEYEKAWRDE